MTARVLLAIFDSVYLLALAALVGSLLFFVLGVAPLLSRVLGAEPGRNLVKAVVPFYHVWAVICCAIALPALICGAFCFPELRGPLIGIQAASIVGCVVMLFLSVRGVTPLLNESRDGGPTSPWRFDRLSHITVRRNVIVLLIAVLLLIGFASRKGLRTDGIEEHSPKERATRTLSKPDRP